MTGLRTPAILLAVVTLLAGGCGGPDDTVDGDGAARVPPPDAGPVFVEDTRIVLADDSVEVVLSGDLPTPCHAVQTAVGTAGGPGEDGDGAERVDVTVWSERVVPEDEACAQVLAPFETSVSTPIPEGVDVDVYVNDEYRGTVSR